MLSKHRIEFTFALFPSQRLDELWLQRVPLLVTHTCQLILRIPPFPQPMNVPIL